MWPFDVWGSRVPSQPDTRIVVSQLEEDSNQIERPAKRKRAIANERPLGDTSCIFLWIPNQYSTSELERDAEYYFDDGNIVLVAEDSIFRVHKGVLSLHSSFFKDLFSLPQPSDAETLDGCPVAHLTDPARHIKLLLGAMYRGAYSLLELDGASWARNEGTTMADLHDLSRVGDKYAVKHLLDYVYHKLVVTFPAVRLADWNDFHLCMDAAKVRPGDSRRMDLLYAIQMIRLWHPRATKILPVIFYTLCQFPLHEICIPGAGDPVTLSQRDLERCLKAIPQLLKHKIRLYNAISTELYPLSCENVNEEICTRAMGTLSCQIMLRDTATLPCPLEDVDQWYRRRLEWTGLCDSCTEMITSKHWRYRVETWEDLGNIFGIPEWLDVDKSDSEFLTS